ncbi:response regulator [uncultured Marivirga sp.]|uniref:response regulator n=1 Tax=uncultured Marivirga sp. TaxID=1123707 RepID=UPI0030EDD3BD|tara:strand:+ start:222017 stop:222403 length:387 start_codon:yes stop_codon:yes gene_type:complete
MNLKNLIVDDDEISLMLSEMIVEGDSFFQKPKKFLDGTYALEFLREDYSQDKTYAIILDINMPFMNGWEFLENIEHFVSSDNTYVFMLSSSSDKADIQKSDKFKLVKGYFTKPLQKEHLEQIQELISK